MKKRVLFLIHDLGPRGAEKVLVNLANGLDRNKFDVSVRTLFDWGPNRDALAPDVHYSFWIGRVIRGNSHLMKLWTPEQLWKMIIPEKFDVVAAFLEGPCSRVAGGCPQDGTKIVSWIHTPIKDTRKFTEGFRNFSEAVRCYSRADAVVFVSEDVKKAFLRHFQPKKRTEILYNVFDSERIKSLASEEPACPAPDPSQLNWCGIGRMVSEKGWERMLKIQRKLLDDGFPAHFYLIGDGPQQKEFENLAENLGLGSSVTFTGYLGNPYAILSRCIVFVSASLREGFSSTAVESLIVGTPVCTVDVGGMREILGSNGEYGVITQNDDEALYKAVCHFFSDEEYQKLCRMKALERGSHFGSQQTLSAAESFLLSL